MFKIVIETGLCFFKIIFEKNNWRSEKCNSNSERSNVSFEILKDNFMDFITLKK